MNDKPWEQSFDMPSGAVIDRVEWTNEGNKVRIFYHQPDPPKPAGVIARPGMRVKPINYMGRINNGTVICVSTFERMRRGSLPTGHVPMVEDNGDESSFKPSILLLEKTGEPITGYEDD